MSSSSNSPCAACKLLRRKCTRECVFAPYFPSDEPAKFASVHKVFGASNVTKILNDLPPGQRADAVKSLAYEADARLRDPVYGCVGTISILQHKLKQIHMDIMAAKQELTSYMSSSPCNINMMIPNHRQGIVQMQPQHNNIMLIRDQQQQQQLYEAQRIAAAISARAQQELMNNRNYGVQQQQEFVKSYDNNMAACDGAAAMVMGGVEGVLQNRMSHGGNAMPPPQQSMALLGGFENPYNNSNNNQIPYQQSQIQVHEEDHKRSVVEDHELAFVAEATTADFGS